MISREKIFEIMREKGRQDALILQDASIDMTNDEINSNDYQIPSFQSAIKNMNMMDRPIGFICKSTVGRVVKLIQNYDSTIFTQEPEELPAQWAFVWSTDPTKAKPFVAVSTSPYNIGDCCIGDDMIVYKSLINNNVWHPNSYPAGWESVGEYEGEMTYGLYTSLFLD